MARPPGILPSGCAGGFRGFSTARPRTGEELARIHASHPADFPPPARRAIGAPGRAARFRRALFRRARAPRNERRSAFAVASGAHDARLFFRGPWTAVRRRREGRAAGESMDGLAFSRGQEPARKARLCLTHLPGTTPGKRQPGWPFSLVTFSLATQRESNSGAAGARKLLANHATTDKRSREPPPLTPTLSPEGRGGKCQRRAMHGAHV